MNNKVLLIYTGGTIGMGRNPRTGALEPLDFNNIVSNRFRMSHNVIFKDYYRKVFKK